jgi:hypothetical protein
MGRGRSNHGKDGGKVQNLKGRNHFEGIGLYRKIGLKWISKQ